MIQIELSWFNSLFGRSIYGITRIYNIIFREMITVEGGASIMAKFDQLDEVLNNSTLTMEDYLSLAQVLDEEHHMPMDPEERREFLNKNIRHAYGNFLPNAFRNWWEPDYVEIVRAVAKKMSVHYDSTMSVEAIEENILRDVIDLAKKAIIKEKGSQEWDKIMQETEAGIHQAITEGRIKADEAAKLKSLSGLFSI